MTVDFYLDNPYKKGETEVEKDEIRKIIRELKRSKKQIPSILLNPNKTAIYLYVRLSGKTIKVNSHQYITPCHWDAEKQKAIRSYTGCVELNSLLDSWKLEAHKNYRLLQLEYPQVSLEQVDKMIREIFELKFPDENEKTLFDIFDEFVEVKRTDKKLSTIKKYKTLLQHLQNFQTKKGYSLSFENINLKFNELFRGYLINDLGHVNNSVGKYISTLKVFLNWTIDRGYNSNTSFSKFKVVNEPGDIIYLSEIELLKMYHHDLSNDERLDKTRNIFLFQCFTGQRFSDVVNIKREDIKGNTWFLRTQKTQAALTIPLNEYAISILNKYHSSPTPLPQISNQKANKYLKDLGEVLEINDPITLTSYSGAKVIKVTKPKHKFIGTHTARRTFVTLSLEKGMRPETVMNITGHRDYKVMKRYLKITSKVTETEMNNIWKIKSQV